MMKELDVVLAQTPNVGRVQLCSCSCVHLTIGPVTLNMNPMAFAQAAALVSRAMDELSRVSQFAETETCSHTKQIQ